jgi:hypothetical protein
MGLIDYFSPDEETVTRLLEELEALNEELETPIHRELGVEADWFESMLMSHGGGGPPKGRSLSHFQVTTPLELHFRAVLSEGAQEVRLTRYLT